jgi:hypothetical protein
LKLNISLPWITKVRRWLDKNNLLGGSSKESEVISNLDDVLGGSSTY